MMRIRIHDWEKHFERDRTKQWKNIQWVPIPNKQGTGYKKIMRDRINGPTIFGCWISLVEIASKCDPRGDLSKYVIDELSLLTDIDVCVIEMSIRFLSEVLDWVEIIEDTKKTTTNLDVTVKINDVHAVTPPIDSSVLSSSIQCNSGKGCGEGGHKQRSQQSFKISGQDISVAFFDFVIANATDEHEAAKILYRAKAANPQNISAWVVAGLKDGYALKPCIDEENNQRKVNDWVDKILAHIDNLKK